MVKTRLSLLLMALGVSSGTVAYIARNPDDSVSNELDSGHVSRWQELYNDAYQQADATIDPTFNTTGWNSNYTGHQIPEKEMREWVDRTTERILWPADVIAGKGW